MSTPPPAGISTSCVVLSTGNTGPGSAYRCAEPDPVVRDFSTGRICVAHSETITTGNLDR